MGSDVTQSDGLITKNFDMAACIRDTRQEVWEIIFYLQHGWSEDDILRTYTKLTQGDLIAVKQYYEDHKNEIDRELSVLIRKKEGVCGGRARIRNHRIPVWGIIVHLKNGGSENSILENFPTLTVTDIDACRTYYDLYRNEIDYDIAQQEDDYVEH